MPRLLLPVLGLLAALALSGCGAQNPHLIPQTRAAALTETVDKIGSTCADGNRAEAEAAVTAARQQIEALPASLDSRLRARLTQWVRHIDNRLSHDCKKQATATPTPTETSTPTPTPSATPSASATPTATATAPSKQG